MYKSIIVFIQHTYCKVITEDPVTFVNKMSAVVTCSKIKNDLFYQGAGPTCYNIKELTGYNAV